MANLTGPVGLYLLSQTLENKGANAIIKKEFKIPNQDAGTSDSSELNSLSNIQMTMPQIITKLVPSKIFDKAYF